MDIRHLQYFLEVARLRSFTKAAQSMFITQPTISKTIKSLEDELGVALFDRIGKRIELTDAGKVIELQAQAIVKSFQSLSSELSDLMNLKKRAHPYRSASHGRIELFSTRHWGISQGISRCDHSAI